MRLLPALALLSCLTPIFPAAALSVRVVTTPGGPQIAVDGKPIPPRDKMRIRKIGSRRWRLHLKRRSLGRLRKPRASQDGSGGRA